MVDFMNATDQVASRDVSERQAISITNNVREVSGVLLLLVCACVPCTAAPVYVATNRGVYSSVDSGVTWQRLGGDLPEPGAYALAVDPSAQNVLYAATVKGVFRSEDRGQAWSSTSLRNVMTNLVADRSSSRSRIYAFEISPVWRTDDVGATWSPIFEPPNPSFPTSLAIDVDDRSTLYLGNRGGVLKSQDDGRTWLPTGAELPTSWITSARGGRLYRGGNGGMWRSFDAGDTWETLNPPEPLLRSLYGSDAEELGVMATTTPCDGTEKPFYCIAVNRAVADPQDGDSLHACVSARFIDIVWSSAVMTYRDGQWSMHHLGNQTFCTALAIDSQMPQLAYVGYSDGYIDGPMRTGLMRTLDGGVTWEEVPEFRSLYVLAVTIASD